MKKLLFFLMTIIPLLLLGCTKEDAQVLDDNTEKVLADLKEKYGIEYERVNSAGDSSKIMSLEELQSFFNEFENQSKQGKSRIAAPELYSAHSIEAFVPVTGYYAQADLMGTFYIGRYPITFRFLIYPNSYNPYIGVEYILFEYRDANCYECDAVLGTGDYIRFYAMAEISLRTPDQQGVEYRVNWKFHISGELPYDFVLFGVRQITMYLSTGGYDESRI